MAQTQNRPVAGVLWMLVTGIMFVAVTAIVKHVGSDLPAAQSAFLRYLLGLVFLIPAIGPLRRAKLTPRALKLFGFRGLVHTFGVASWFYAMTQISIAEVTAMNYLAPIYVSIGAAVFLGERLAARRIFAVIMGLVGAVIILRPGFIVLDIGAVMVIASAVLWGMAMRWVSMAGSPCFLPVGFFLSWATRSMRPSQPSIAAPATTMTRPRSAFCCRCSGRWWPWGSAFGSRRSWLGRWLRPWRQSLADVVAPSGLSGAFPSQPHNLRANDDVILDSEMLLSQIPLPVYEYQAGCALQLVGGHRFGYRLLRLLIDCHGEAKAIFV